MSKHTPGPWIGAGPSFGDPLPRYTTDIYTEWEDENGEVISICELPFNHHDDENEANALLIAAAPDLLEALKLCLPYVRAAMQSTGGMAEYKAELAADAAIAKAEGEQE
jgi:sialic acid synthase SpsE